MGPRYVLVVMVGASRLTAVVEAAVVGGWESTPVPGDTVAVDIRSERIHLFDTESGLRI